MIFKPSVSARKVFEHARLPANAVRVKLITAPSEKNFGGLDERFPYMSLAPAQLCGYMATHGYTNCLHHDLNLLMERRLRKSQRETDLSVFLDTTAVDKYLAGSDRGNVISRAIALILGLCEPGPVDLIGLSLVSQFATQRDVQRLLSFDLCLLHAMKERYPDCVTVLGGLYHMSASVKPMLLARCRSLDFVVEGQGERAFYNIAEAVFNGRGFQETGQAHEEHGG